MKKAIEAVLSLTAVGIMAAASSQAVAATPLTIDTVIKDMSLSSEAMVIDPKYDWQSKPKVTQWAPSGTILPSWWTGTRPQWCYNVLTWYTAFEAQGNAATNTRLAVRNLRIYVLSNKTRTWTLVDAVAQPYTDLWKYPFNYAGDYTAAAMRKETDGGYSMKPKYPNFEHGYGKTAALADPSDVRAVFMAIDFKLVVDNPALADDRAKARYVVDVGADYYPGKGMSWGLGYAPGLGNGRYLLATNDWRTATLLVPNKSMNATSEEIRTNPPPLK